MSSSRGSVRPTTRFDLPVLGVGLVSPAGRDALQSVVFSKASVIAPGPSLFVRLDGDPMDEEDLPPVELSYCPWWPVVVESGPNEAGQSVLAQRLIALAMAALREALSYLLPLEQRLQPDALRACPPEALGCPLHLCVSRPRPGLTQAEVDTLSVVLSRYLVSTKTTLHFGEAGVFSALRDIGGQGATGGRAVVVGVDSFVSLLAADDAVRFPVSDWEPLPPAPSEAAAALLLGAPGERGEPDRVLATVHSVGAVTEEVNDLNELPLKGSALTYLLSTLPAGPGIRAVFGQDSVSSLRRREWEMAAGRYRDRFAVEFATETVESYLGRLGAAAGIASLAYAITALRTGKLEVPARAPVCAWAISPEGLRGLAVFSSDTGK